MNHKQTAATRDSEAGHVLKMSKQILNEVCKPEWRQDAYLPGHDALHRVATDLIQIYRRHSVSQNDTGTLGDLLEVLSLWYSVAHAHPCDE